VSFSFSLRNWLIEPFPCHALGRRFPHNHISHGRKSFSLLLYPLFPPAEPCEARLFYADRCAPPFFLPPTPLDADTWPPDQSSFPFQTYDHGPFFFESGSVWRGPLVPKTRPSLLASANDDINGSILILPFPSPNKAVMFGIQMEHSALGWSFSLFLVVHLVSRLMFKKLPSLLPYGSLPPWLVTRGLRNVFQLFSASPSSVALRASYFASTFSPPLSLDPKSPF